MADEQDEGPSMTSSAAGDALEARNPIDPRSARLTRRGLIAAAAASAGGVVLARLPA